MRTPKDVILVIDQETGEIVGQYGVIGGPRGRELVERALRHHHNLYAEYNGKPLDWYRGPYGDVLLDSPNLPEQARATRYLGDSPVRCDINGEPITILTNITREELVSQIYDTLVENVGMTEKHTAFPVDQLSYQYVDETAGRIYFEFHDRAFEIIVRPVPFESD